MLKPPCWERMRDFRDEGWMNSVRADGFRRFIDLVYINRMSVSKGFEINNVVDLIALPTKKDSQEV